MAGKLERGNFIYVLGDGNTFTFSGIHNIETDTYQVMMGHGYMCPWSFGGELANKWGVGVRELLFHVEEWDETVELYYDRSGLWMLTSIEPFLRKMAPVPWREACRTR